MQRSWALLLGLLRGVELVGSSQPLDLVELGASAGLNLLLDRFRYRYGDVPWGPQDAELELTGDARGGPPPSMLRLGVNVRRRIGIDRAPVDVRSEQGTLLLEAFAWADQSERLERLRRALDIGRRDPPRLVRGDYVELMPGLLEEHDSGADLVVLSSASTVYLAADSFSRLRRAIERAGERGRLAWVSLEGVGGGPMSWEEFHRFGGHALEVQVWPGGERRLLARVDGHGEWLEWLES